MKGIIVCFVGDYAICKNDKNEVFNINKRDILEYNVGDEIFINEENNKDIDDKNKEEGYYLCDDVVIFNFKDN